VMDKEVITVGRKPGNNIVIDNLAVSGFHAKIVHEAGQYFIEDLNSTNGTFVARKRVSKCPLRDSDEITIGKHTLKFLSEMPEAEQSPEATVRIRTRPLDGTVIVNARKQPMLPESAEGTGSAAGTRVGVLTVVSGAADKQIYELSERLTTIGSADSAGVRLKGFFAPEVAALINRVGAEYFINQPGRGKKPLVNGTVVEGRQVLHEGDVIDVGKVKLQFTLKE
jgi:pSer/pThr/pTyr-binding forkhead associated (FHA) protein